MKPKLAIGIVFLLLCSTTWAQNRFRPGDVVPEPYLKVYGTLGFFTAVPISESLKAQMNGCSYKAMGGVGWDDLRYLRVLHCDAEGNAVVGEMVCNKAIADDLLSILKALYDAGYPIEKMRLVECYGGDDEASMYDNNTSCFNQRRTAGGKISKHSYGMAVDINPRYNPYLRQGTNRNIVQPQGSEVYLDRGKDFPYKIMRGDLCYRLFRQHGFRWGGDWLRGKDYQHFDRSQTSNR